MQRSWWRLGREQGAACGAAARSLTAVLWPGLRGASSWGLGLFLLGVFGCFYFFLFLFFFGCCSLSISRLCGQGEARTPSLAV